MEKQLRLTLPMNFRQAKRQLEDGSETVDMIVEGYAFKYDVETVLYEREDGFQYREVIEKGALDEFGGYRNIDFNRFNFWRTIERCSWINRMYFIAPLANHARKTGDKKLGREVLEVMLRFAAEDRKSTRLNSSHVT